MQRLSSLLLLLALSMVFCLSAKAQHPPLDSLTRQLEELFNTSKAQAQIKADSVRRYARDNDWSEGHAAALKLLIRYQRSVGNYDSAALLVQEGMHVIDAVRKDINQKNAFFWGNTQCVLTYELAVIDYYRGDYNGSLQKLGKIDSLFADYQQRYQLPKDTFNERKAVMHSLKGNIFYTQGDLQSAARTFEETAKLHESSGDLYNMCVVSLNAGTTYKEMGDLVKAIRLYTRGLQIAQEQGYKNMEAVLLGGIGQLYYTLQEYPKALGFALASYRIQLADNNKHGLAERAPDLGDLYKKLGRYDSARWYYEEGLRLHTEMDQKDDQAYVLQRLAQLYLDNDQYNKALTAVEKGLVIARETELFEEQIWLNVTRTSVLLALDKPEEALATARLLQDFARETNNLAQRKDIYEVSYQAFAANGRMQEAFDYLLQYSNAKDSLYREEKNLAVAKAEYDLALENEKQVMAEQQARQELIYEQELARERWWLYAAIGTSVFLLIIVWVSWQSYRRKKTANELLHYKNETIEAKNEELMAKNEELHAMREREHENQERERKLLLESVTSKEKELAATAMVNHEKNMVLSNLSNRIEELSGKANEDLQKELRLLKRSVSAQINTEETWESFIHQFESIHPHFFDKLKARFPELTITDLKLCAYIRVGMNNKEIAQASNLAVSSVKKSINRIKKKLELSPDQSIRDFMLLSLEA